MLNMTALKISLEKNIEASTKYALGVSLVIIPQVYIAIYLTKFITNNPKIIETLDKLGVFIFLLLSFYFYRESKKEKVQVATEIIKKGNPFLKGVTFSLLNMFSIPFFCGVVVGLDVFNLFKFDIFSILFFVLGSVFGTFYILYLYGKYAIIIKKKTGRITKDINLLLSILTGLVAVFTLIKIFY